MAAKLLHSLADDNPDLKKQIGCVTGIFQLFDRQQMITAKRITAHSPLMVSPPGSSHLNCGCSQQEPSNVPSRFGVTENQMSKNVHDKHKPSTESSRPSFSSSSGSSSFSSLDCNKAPQSESLSYDQTIFYDPPSEQVICLPNESYQFDQQQFDLRDVVKDSIYNETQILSVKTATRDREVDSLKRSRNSTRPSQLPNTGDRYSGLGPGGNQESSFGPKESLRVLAKLRDAPHCFNEPRELSRSSSYHTRDVPSFLIPKDAPRLSYDGREMNHSAVGPQDSFNSYMKHKDLPSLSIDSRESSRRNLNSDSRSSSNSKNYQTENSTHVNNPIQTPGAQSRSPSVVAKLMGLEMLPESVCTREHKMGLSRTSPAEDASSLSRPSEATDLYLPIHSFNGSKNFWREPHSPHWKNSDSVMKPLARFSIEPTPWKQFDGTRSAPAQKIVKPKSKKSAPVPSVYGEIDKRLNDIEFSSSGKDLRALKQILEAMQDKVLLAGKVEGQDLTYSTTGDPERIYTNLIQNTRLANERKPQVGQVINSRMKGLSASRNLESPIVIMKPAKLNEKFGVPSSSRIPLHSIPSPELQCGDSTESRSVKGNSRKDHLSKPIHGGDTSLKPDDDKWNKKTLNSTHTSVRFQQQPKECSAISNSSGSVRPRMQHNKTELETRSQPRTPPSDSNKLKRQSGLRPKDSNSPGGRSKLNSNSPGSDRVTDFLPDSTDLSSNHSRSLVEVDKNAMLDPMVITEVGPYEKSREKRNDKTPTRSGGQNLISSFAKKKSLLVLSKDESIPEVTTDTPEYPSPVSVLDSATYDNHSPSPMKQIVKTVIGGKFLSSDRFSSTGQLRSAAEVESNDVGSCLSSDINRKKFQNIENLVQKLKRLNSSHDEAQTDYIASLSENPNPDDRYISEVLLASGLLLRDLGSSLTTFQFHSSGNPINPELFLVLEQIKASRITKQSSPETVMQVKFHRKLIFDYVNEILAQKLVSVEPWSQTRNLAKKTVSARKLLRELCSEVEQLQTKRSEDEEDSDELKIIFWEDVMNDSWRWTDFKSEMSRIVLDVERSIFRELVDEVVIGESTAPKTKPVRRRQLFGN